MFYYVQNVEKNMYNNFHDDQKKFPMKNFLASFDENYFFYLKKIQIKFWLFFQIILSRIQYINIPWQLKIIFELFESISVSADLPEYGNNSLDRHFWWKICM